MMDVRINIDDEDDHHPALHDHADSNTDLDSPITLPATRCPNLYHLYLQQNMDVEIHIINPVVTSTSSAIVPPAPDPAVATTTPIDVDVSMTHTEMESSSDDELSDQDSISSICNVRKPVIKRHHILLANRTILSAASTKLRDMLDAVANTAAGAASLESTTSLNTSISSSTSSSPSRLKLLIDDPRITPLTMMRLLHDIYRRADRMNVDIHMNRSDVISNCVDDIKPQYDIKQKLLSYDRLLPIRYLSELSDLLYVAVKYDVTALINNICSTLRCSCFSTTCIPFHLMIEPYHGRGYACIDSLCTTLSAECAKEMALRAADAAALASASVISRRATCCFCLCVFLTLGILGAYIGTNNPWFLLIMFVPSIILGIGFYMCSFKYPQLWDETPQDTNMRLHQEVRAAYRQTHGNMTHVHPF